MLNQVQSSRAGKKILSFLLLTMSIYVSYGQTNVYHPFPNNGAMWSVKWDGAFKCQNIDYFSYGDSTISNLGYSKVWVTGIEETCINQQTSDTISKYAGAFRNDTLTRKVYWLEPDSLLEKLLYNFDVNVGDTLPSVMFNMYPIPSPVIVKTKDSVLLADGTYRNSHWIGYAGQLGSFRRIIEGIGSEGGLIENLEDYLSQIFYLKCFTMDTVSLYPNSGNTCYPYYPLGFIEPKENPKITVFPNPTNGTFNLPKDFQYEEIKIYNSYGQEITFTFLNKNEIDINMQPAGLYFVKIWDGKKVYVAKVMKQ